MVFIIVLLSLVLPERVRATQANDLTEKEAKTYFGEHFSLLQEGKVEEYWRHVQQAIEGNPEICDLQTALTTLKTCFVDFWQDRDNRMPWVTDPQNQILDPIEDVCNADPDFTLLPFWHQPVRAEEGNVLLKKFQLLRTYCLLSAVASYIYDPQARKVNVRDGQRFFASQSGFLDFCEHYAVSKLYTTDDPPGFLAESLQSLMHTTYTWYTHLHEHQHLKVLGYLSAQGHCPIYVWLAALEKGQLLIHMPYMQEGVASACGEKQQRAFDRESFSCFRDSFAEGKRVAEVLALWPKTVRKDHHFLQCIAKEMQEQMRGTNGNLKEMLKIIWVYSCAMRYMLCPQNVFPEHHTQMVQGFYDSDFLTPDPFYRLPDYSCQALLGEGSKREMEAMLESCRKQWFTQYFVKGLENIITHKGHLAPQETLEKCAEEFKSEFGKELGCSNPTAHDILKLFESIQAVGREDARSVLVECAWDKIPSAAHHANNALLQQALVDETLRMYIATRKAAIWSAKNLKKVPVRCALWDIKQPFIGWQHREQVLIVCLPKKTNMALFIQDMAWLSNCPILQERACYQVICTLSDQAAATAQNKRLFFERYTSMLCNEI